MKNCVTQGVRLFVYCLVETDSSLSSRYTILLNHYKSDLAHLSDLYSGRPVDNSPEFMPLYHSLNRDIWHSLSFHCVLSRFLLDGEGTDEEERNIRFSFSAPKEIARGLKRIWESKMGTPSSARIIQDVDLELKALEIVYLANGAAVEGLADRNTDEKW